MSYLIVLAAYVAGLVGLGLFVSRRVQSTRDFFVAGRALPPGLIFATFLAANIGAGSTVGATGLGFTKGLSAVWWVGSAGIGSLILAFLVGPRIYRIARDNNLFTVGDYLEMRYNRNVRLFFGVTLWVGSLFILAGQLLAMSSIVSVTSGVAKPWGCALGGLAVTIYFSFGGLRGAVWLHVIQMAVKITGFAIAVPWALHTAGGWSGLHTAPTPPGYFSPLGIGVTGAIGYLLLLAPNFFISPGLIQRLFGARDESAVRKGVGWQAVVLLLYAVFPAILGMIARTSFPALASPDLALPTVLRELLPWWLGAFLLAAVFSAEMSAGDAVLFMLSTSLGKDLYKSLLNPAASDEQLFRFTRGASLLAGVFGTGLAIWLPTVGSALTVFYSPLTAVLLAPLLAGLYFKFPTATTAVAVMTFSTGVAFATYFFTSRDPGPVAAVASIALMTTIGVFSYVRHVSA